MNLFRTRKLFEIVQLTRMHHPYVCRMSTTPPAWYLPSSDTLFGNYPEPVFHPRMNSPSEQITSNCVRTSCNTYSHVLYLYCYYCHVFIVSSPPSYSVDLDTATAVDVAVFVFDVDDRTPT